MNMTDYETHRMTVAINRANKCRAVALELRDDGYPDCAAQLERSAAEYEKIAESYKTEASHV